MKMSSLYSRNIYNAICENRISSFNIDDVLYAFAGKILIILDIGVSNPNPRDNSFQITRITAIAIDGKNGAEVDNFNKESMLNIATLRGIDLQDRARALGQWDDGDISIRDMLNATDYDLESELTRPSEQEILIGFKRFVDKYASRAIIVGYNIEDSIFYLNHKSEEKIVDAQTFDVLELAQVYFEPVLQVMQMHGVKKASDMISKMWDAIKDKSNITISGLGNALGVKTHQWRSSENTARRLAFVLSKMITFLKTHQKYMSDIYFKKHASSAMELWKHRRSAADSYNEEL